MYHKVQHDFMKTKTGIIFLYADTIFIFFSLGHTEESHIIVLIKKRILTQHHICKKKATNHFRDKKKRVCNLRTNILRRLGKKVKDTFSPNKPTTEFPC